MKFLYFLSLNFFVFPIFFGQNFVSNGNFEFGGTGNGFVNGLGYVFQSPPLSGMSAPGEMTVTNDPQNFNNGLFLSLSDHTSGNGKMLVVDGSNQNGNLPFWVAGNAGGGICNLSVGQTYLFTYWLHSVSSLVSNPITQADVQANFTNATNIQFLNASSLAPLPNNGWQSYAYALDATNTCVNISMYDANSASLGNDFAVDDITLMPIGGPLTATASHTRPNCSDSLSGVFIGYAMGGTPPYTYQLTGMGYALTNNDGVFTQLPSGNYALQVTDANNQTVNLTNEVIYPNDFLTVDPLDTVICPNNNVQLTVSGGTNTNYIWMATPSDPLLLNPINDTVNVSPNQSTEYLVSTNDLNFNLVTNGNFEANQSGFYSELNFLTPNNPTAMQGAFGITTNANFWEPSFSSCVDHTLGNGTGYMLVVDGSTFGNLPVWKQTLAVQPNTTYTFRYFAQSLSANSPAILHSDINGVTLGIDTLTSTTCSWQMFTYSWNAGQDTLCTLTLTDLNQGANGNNFAIDDISFSTLRSCSNVAHVVVLTGNPNLGLTYPNNLCPNGGSVMPSLAAGIPTNGTYNAIPGGVNLNPLNGMVNGNGSNPGIYQVIYSTNLCSVVAKDTFVLTIRPLPSFSSLTGGLYDCGLQSFDSVLLFVSGTAPYSLNYTINGIETNITGNTSPLHLGNSQGVYFLDSLEDVYCFNDITGSLTLDSLAIPALPILMGETVFCANEPVGVISIANPNPMGTINWYADAGLTQWLESGNQFYASNDSAATYYVAQTVNGCIGAPLSFYVEIEACNFIIPTAFTPDNDGDNDVWQIVGLDAKFPLNQVKIYNRWGDILFTSKTGHYNESPWDGKLNGKDLPVGSYYFILEKAEDGSIEPVNGVISILRKP